MSSVQDKLLQIDNVTQTIAFAEDVPELVSVDPLSEDAENTLRLCKLIFKALCQEVPLPLKRKIQEIVQKICVRGAADPDIGKICTLFIKKVLVSQKVTTFSPLCTPAAMPHIDPNNEFERHNGFVQPLGRFERLGTSSLQALKHSDRTELMFRNTLFHDLDVPLANFPLSLESIKYYLVQFLGSCNFKRVAECLDIIHDKKWTGAFIHSLTSEDYNQGNEFDLNALFHLGSILTSFSKHMVKIIAYDETAEPPRKRQKTDEEVAALPCCYMHRVFLQTIPFFERQLSGRWAQQLQEQCVTLEIGVEDPEVLIDIMQHLTSYRPLITVHQPMKDSRDELLDQLQKYIITCELLQEPTLLERYWDIYTTMEPLKVLVDLKPLYAYTGRHELATASNSSFFLAKHFSCLMQGLHTKKQKGVSVQKQASSFLAKNYSGNTSLLLQDIDQQRALIAPYLNVAFNSLQAIGASDQAALLRICFACVSSGSSFCTWWIKFVEDFANDPISTQVGAEVIRALFEQKTPQGYIFGLQFLRKMGTVRYQEALDLGRSLITADVALLLNSYYLQNRELAKEMLTSVATFGYTELCDSFRKKNFYFFVSSAAPLAPDFCWQELQKSSYSQDLFCHYILLSSISEGKDKDLLVQQCVALANKKLQAEHSKINQHDMIALQGLQRRKILPADTQFPLSSPGLTCCNLFEFCLAAKNHNYHRSWFINPSSVEDLIEALWILQDENNAFAGHHIHNNINSIIHECYSTRHAPVFKVCHLNSLLTLVPNRKFSDFAGQLASCVCAIAGRSSTQFYLQSETQSGLLQQLLSHVCRTSFLQHVRAEDEEIVTALCKQAFERLRTLSVDDGDGFNKLKSSLVDHLKQAPANSLQQALIEIASH
jgi:hypothetical protein